MRKAGAPSERVVMEGLGDREGSGRSRSGEMAHETATWSWVGRRARAYKQRLGAGRTGACQVPGTVGAGWVMTGG